MDIKHTVRFEPVGIEIEAEETHEETATATSSEETSNG